MIYALLGPVRMIKLVFTFIFRTQCLIFSSCPIKRIKIILKLQLKIFLKLPKKHWLGHWIPDLDLDLDSKVKNLDLDLDLDLRGEDLDLDLDLWREDLDLDSDCEDLTTSLLSGGRKSFGTFLLANKLSILDCPAFPPLHIGPTFSSPAFSTPEVWCRIFPSCIFHHWIFDRPAFSGLAFQSSRLANNILTVTARYIFNTVMRGQPSPVHHTTGETSGIESSLYRICCAQNRSKISPSGR